MNTRRYPRTMQEAFGPYTNHSIDEQPKSEFWPAVACFAAVIAIGLMMAWRG